MADEQVIKAMEYCATDDGDDCFQCPYGNIVYTPGNGGCVNRCRKDALDLINRQKSEVENLEKQMDWLTGYNKNLMDANTALSEEILEAKAEAYKDFVNRLKNSNEFYSCIRAIGNVDKMDSVVNCIDNLLKEMVGEEE